MELKFKAKIDDVWHEFYLDDVYGGKISVDGIDRQLPSEKDGDLRLFTGKYCMRNHPVYFGDTLQPMYNDLSRFEVTFDNLTRYNLERCRFVE